MRNLAYRALSIQLSPIKQMERQASKSKNILSLAQGIPYFPTSPFITKQVSSAMKDGSASFYTIPEGLLSLRQLISKEVQKKAGTFYHPEGEILVTAGAMAGIQATLLTLINPGDEVLVISPAYASYYNQIITAGGIPKPISLDPENNFRLSMSQLKRSVTVKTKILMFANPANPTGTNFTKTELVSLCKFAKEKDLYIISDEVYRDFIWQGEHTSTASFSEIKNRLFLVFGFSKAYSMTGYRVGYICGPSRVMKHILKIHDNLVTCAPHPAQIAGQQALLEPPEELKWRLLQIKKHRKIALELLGKIPFLSAHIPEGGYYLFAKILDGKIDSFSFCQHLLEKAGVSTVPGVAFGPSGEGYLRICYAVDLVRLQDAFDRILDFYHQGIDFSSFFHVCKRSA